MEPHERIIFGEKSSRGSWGAFPPNYLQIILLYSCNAPHPALSSKRGWCTS